MNKCSPSFIKKKEYNIFFFLPEIYYFKTNIELIADLGSFNNSDSILDTSVKQSFWTAFKIHNTYTSCYYIHL